MRVMSNQEYGEYLKGKRVIMVAHAASMEGSKMGSFIDSYDVVVRINEAVPIPEDLLEDVGTRCDVLYSSLAPQFRITKDKLYQPFLDLGTTVICRPTPLKTNRIEEIKLYSHDVTYWYDRLATALEDVDLAVRVVGQEPYRTHTAKMNGRLPLTGFAALWDLLEFKIEEVYMIGFNFFVGGSYEQYHANPKSENQKEAWKEGTGLYRGRYHVVAPQVNYLKKLIEKDKRIKYDKVLKDVMTKI